MTKRNLSWKSSKDTFQYKVYKVLKKRKWQCRVCSYPQLDVTQIAGGGGIGGLKHGTTNRPGLIIKTQKQFCKKCKKKTFQDRWQGGLKKSVNAKSISRSLVKNIFNVLNYTDVIEDRRRPANSLIIDHKFPMIRWGISESRNNKDMSANEIHDKFQLLKKDSSGNHNLLKSRACEVCFKTGKRGMPLGFHFFYKGTKNWPKRIPKKGPKAEKGCIGCGWYDFNQWRKELNKIISFSLR